MKLIAEILLNQSNESFDFFWFKSPDASALQYLRHVVGAQEGKVMPTFEVGINPRWDSEHSHVRMICSMKGSKLIRRLL